ncbi:hypothetical protein MTR_6g464640 [Medicago truncatula]|uniref:Uncharacterized protein n=1 Tax=Medicago truncatula TaxID=3880 RepID=A0A072UL40_MEDTR|nr:hypothetical protein MTR_6g464640 [Medicago truncatula]
MIHQVPISKHYDYPFIDNVRMTIKHLNPHLEITMVSGLKPLSLAYTNNLPLALEPIRHKPNTHRSSMTIMLLLDKNFSLNMYKEHHKHKRSSKTMVEDLKNGQTEVNFLDQNKGFYLETEDYDQTLKNHQAQKTSSDLEDLQT